MTSPRDRAGHAASPLAGLAAVAVCVFYIAIIAQHWLSTGQPWFRDAEGRILEHDFAAYATAARMAAAGQAAAAYDPAAFSAAMAGLTSLPGPPGLRWLNPPTLLLLLAPLAHLPYDAAFLSWLLGTGLLFGIAVHRILPRPGALPIAFAPPATIPNVINGQSGFLSGALLGFGLALTDRRPVLAGLCLGAMSYKPHLAVVLPLLLAAGGHWRVLGTAAATAAGLALLSAAIFGPEAWLAFLRSMGGTAGHFLGDSPTRAAMLTVYAATATLGAGALAMPAHLAVLGVALAASAILWRARATLDLRAAAAIATCFLATPYAFTHDAAVLTVAAAFLLAARAVGPPIRGEAAVILLALILPGVGMVTQAGLLGPLAALLLLGSALRRWRLEHPRRQEA